MERESPSQDLLHPETLSICKDGPLSSWTKSKMLLLRTLLKRTPLLYLKYRFCPYQFIVNGRTYKLLHLGASSLLTFIFLFKKTQIQKLSKKTHKTNYSS